MTDRNGLVFVTLLLAQSLALANYWLGETEITDVSEKVVGNNHSTFFSAPCFDLRPGSIDIRAETVFNRGKQHDFEVREYVGAPEESAGQIVRMQAKVPIQRWRLGRVQVNQGTGRNPIEADVEFSPSPITAP